LYKIDPKFHEKFHVSSLKGDTVIDILVIFSCKNGVKMRFFERKKATWHFLGDSNALPKSKIAKNKSRAGQVGFIIFVIDVGLRSPHGCDDNHIAFGCKLEHFHHVGC